VKRDTGLRTARRVSHCFVMDVPGREEGLIITDAAVNIFPTLEEKADILQNAIDLAHALGIAEVRVAVLSAMETINSKVPSTIEAAALCKMMDRHQVSGALIDGPLALDNAIDPDAARIKKIDSPVAGRANVLLVPDLEAGNMLAKSLTFMAGAEIVEAPNSEASATAAVKLVREGKAEALMKGSLHTDELMAAVVRRETGLRTARRVSHCFVMDVPGRDEGLIITDAAVNIFPTLEEKADILQNAIDLAHALGIAEVRVAVLSAMETINSKVPSTIEAAALCKMMDRHQVSGALIDGPLALDNAIDPEAARIKKIDSPVAGRANVLLVPDLEAGNMLAKSLTFMAGADAAGIVLGARVPIILTSRADSLITRLASCAVAVLVAKARREAGKAVG